MAGTPGTVPVIGGDGKLAADIMPAGGGGAAWGGVTGTLADQTDLQTALDTKAASAHSHDYAATSHTHPQSDVTSLVTALSGKSDTSHNHNASYEPINANIQAHIASAHAPSNAQKNSDITKAEIEAKLTGAITSHSHSGGADPWTVIRLGTTFPTTSATAVDVTGLAFTPLANTTYEFYAMLMCRTATTTVGGRPGCAWPTGLTDGVASIEITSSATAKVFANGNITAAVLAPVGGFPTTTGSWPGCVYGVLFAGASPSGTFRVQLASETAGTSVSIIAGSFLRYRVIA